MKIFAIAALLAIAGGSAPNYTPPTVELPVIPATWKCPDCSPAEQYVLKELQEHTKITDRNALATILGNIKQESKFIPNICDCLLYTSPSPRDGLLSRMPSSA